MFNLACYYMEEEEEKSFGSDTFCPTPYLPLYHQTNKIIEI